jgi:hypothetical protein
MVFGCCVTSKKFIKFLRKSLKEFGLNLKRKVCFKKSLKKKRKKRESLPPFPSTQPACRPTKTLSQRPVTLLSFLFFPRTPTSGPCLSASPLPFLSSFSPRCPADPAPPCDPRRAPQLSFFPSSPSRPIKAINLPRDQLEPLPFLKHLAVMAAAITGKRRRPGSSRLPSPSSL